MERREASISSHGYADPEVLFYDEHYVAVHKPPGLLVHRTAMAHAEHFLLQLVRDRIGQRVYPVHRLDRATSGVIVFGLSSEAVTRLQAVFNDGSTTKTYHALVRGWIHERGIVDHPVSDRDAGTEPKPGVTHYRPLAHTEILEPVDRYPSARYSLVEAHPVTGRRHQIRYHFKHICHPIVGDTTYGKGTHNRFFRERFGVDRLMLRSHRLSFVHPYTREPVQIDAAVEPQWESLMDRLEWHEVN